MLDNSIRIHTGWSKK